MDKTSDHETLLYTFLINDTHYYSYYYYCEMSNLIKPSKHTNHPLNTTSIVTTVLSNKYSGIFHSSFPSHIQWWFSPKYLHFFDHNAFSSVINQKIQQYPLIGYITIGRSDWLLLSEPWIWSKWVYVKIEKPWKS
jgi:hypothetical protein